MLQVKITDFLQVDKVLLQRVRGFIKDVYFTTKTLIVDLPKS